MILSCRSNPHGRWASRAIRGPLGRLRDALTSKDATLRAAAALALGALRNQAPLNDLVALLQSDGNSMVREAAAQALGMIGSVKALPALDRVAEADTKNKVDARLPELPPK